MPSTTTDRLAGTTTSVAVKAPCRVATSANITLSGLQTIDGIALAEGDRVLVKNQTAGADNGIYNVWSTDWTRAPDWDGSLDVVTGTIVYIVAGLTYAGGFWQVTTVDDITVGTTSLAFTAVPFTSGAVGLFTDGDTLNIPLAADLLQTSGHTTDGIGGGLYSTTLPDGTAVDAAFVADHPALAFTSANSRHFALVPHLGIVLAEQAGALGDNTTNDRAACQAGIDYAAVVDAEFWLSAGKTYKIGQMPTSVHNYGIGAQPCLVLPWNCRGFDARDSTIRLFEGGRAIFADNALYPNTAVTSNITADVAAGAYVIAVADGSQFATGNDVLVQAGEVPYDKPETDNWYFAQVVSVAGNDLTLDQPMPRAFSLASMTTGPMKRVMKLPTLVPLAIRNLFIDGKINASTGAETGIRVAHRKNVTIDGVGGRFCGSAVVYSQYVDNITVSNSTATGANTTQVSYGAHLHFSETRGALVIGGHARGMLKGITGEVAAEVRARGYHFEDTYPGNGTLPAANTVKVFTAVGRSKLVLTDTLITGNGGCNLSEISNGQAGWEGDVQFGGETRIMTATAIANMRLRSFSGVLEMDVAGTRERYNTDRYQTWTRRFRLKDGMAFSAFGPPGLRLSSRVFITADVSVGAGNDLTNLSIGKTSNNGTNYATATVAAGQMTNIDYVAGDAMWQYRNEANKVVLITGASAGLNAKDAFVQIETDYVIEEGAKTYAYSEADFRGEGGEYEFYEALVSAVDLASIAAGATGTATLTIPDMTNSDVFVGFSIVGGYGGLELVKFEPQTGQGVATFYNRTGSPIDLTARDMRVLFAKGQVGA